jgi:anti-sigma regulatory factor (Ser/Thr protein kinase)
MCRHSTVALDESVHAPRIGRAWTVERLERWGLGQITELASIMASELVGNAIVHAQSSPFLSLAVVEGVLEFGCRDLVPADRPLVAARHEHHGDDPPPPRGRGLMIVDTLSDQWGEQRTDDGKEVWFRLSIGEWPYLHDCMCHTQEGDHVRLGSGDVAHHNSGVWDL